MSQSNQELRQWLLEEFSERLAVVIESMAAERPPIQAEASAAHSLSGSLIWKQPFSGVSGTFWLAAPEADWTALGTHILRAAGLGPEDIDAASVELSFLEVVSQSLGGMAQAMSARLGREVTPASGSKIVEESGKPPSTWDAVKLQLGVTPAAVYITAEPALLESLAPPKADAPQRIHANNFANNAPASSAGLELESKSRTLDLLLDVELPVSVSFGKADVVLKDVLKLTTGSIVELNRTLQEPVEVVVNNCVIARGEVVVIEGNFGVRIQQVVSRQDRLKTLR